MKNHSHEQLKKEIDSVLCVHECTGRCADRIMQLLVKHEESLIEEMRKPKENPRGFIVEGEVCHFCKGTGRYGNQNILC